MVVLFLCDTGAVMLFLSFFRRKIMLFKQKTCEKEKNVIQSFEDWEVAVFCAYCQHKMSQNRSQMEKLK